MASRIRERLRELKVLALSHQAVGSFRIRGEEVFKNKGYLRMRMVLRSQDVVEVFVYLVEEGEEARLKDYSIHWQQADGSLVQRWDTAPHHQELESFPYHTHRPTGLVEPTPPLQWDDMLSALT